MTNHNMLRQETAEAIGIMVHAGLHPQVCDTSIPLSSCPVRCGLPAEPGDTALDDYVLLPKALVGHYPEMYVPVTGDSMRDAGYDEGDRLRISLGAPIHDGDNVLACIGTGCTVKTYFTDEEGQH